MNQNIWENNISALRKNHPQLAQTIENLSDIPALTLGKTTSGDHEIMYNFNDGSSKPFYNVESSLNFSKLLVKQIKFTNPRLVIFLGIGLGMHLREYARDPHKLNQGIAIFESIPQVFKLALQTTDLTPLINNTKVFWCIGDNKLMISQFLANLFSKTTWLSFANAIEYVPLPQSLQFASKYFEYVRSAVPEAIGHQFNRYFGDPYDAYIGTNNTLNNLPKLMSMPAIDNAAGCCAGKPGVVISSGPSLKFSLPVLKKLQQQAVIIAVPSSLPLLLKEGIQPHIWINIERLAEQGEFLKNLPKHPEHIFVGPPLVHPTCFADTNATNCYVRGASLQTEWLPLNGSIFELGHSSSHAAFLILQMLGCDQIFMFGQDLSYSNDGSHAEGVWEESQKTMMNLADGKGKTFPLESNDGKIVNANVYWHTYFKTFSEYVLPNYKGKAYNVIPANMGAKLPGATQINPESFFEIISQTEWEPLSILKSKLQPVSQEIQNQRTNLASATIIETKQALKRLAKDSLKFALRAKEIQYNQAMLTHSWEKAEPIYTSFLKEVETFANRYINMPLDSKERLAYFGFFQPIVQGQLLRYNIEYYKSATDISGDFGEISRKLEILYHMAKDETYWASVLLNLLNQVEL